MIRPSVRTGPGARPRRPPAGPGQRVRADVLARPARRRVGGAARVSGPSRPIRVRWLAARAIINPVSGMFTLTRANERARHRPVWRRSARKCRPECERTSASVCVCLVCLIVRPTRARAHDTGPSHGEHVLTFHGASLLHARLTNSAALSRPEATDERDRAQGRGYWPTESGRLLPPPPSVGASTVAN
jgi:hypothetical protein